MSSEPKPSPDPTEAEPTREPGTTWAGNPSLDTRWWWSPVLWVVVGVVVIWYQLTAVTGEGGIWLNWVLVAVGGAVAVKGLVALLKAYRNRPTGDGASPPV